MEKDNFVERDAYRIYVRNDFGDYMCIFVLFIGLNFMYKKIVQNGLQDLYELG